MRARVWRGGSSKRGSSWRCPSATTAAARARWGRRRRRPRPLAVGCCAWVARRALPTWPSGRKRNAGGRRWRSRSAHRR
eukprot:4627984-Prymnesium_polylepis.1